MMIIIIVSLDILINVTRIAWLELRRGPWGLTDPRPPPSGEF